MLSSASKDLSRRFWILLLVFALAFPHGASAADKGSPRSEASERAAEPTAPVGGLHRENELQRFQAAIDTDKIGKDYSSYLEGLVALRCPDVLAQNKKGLIVYFKNKGTGEIFPIVVRCNADGSGIFASAQELLHSEGPRDSVSCISSLPDFQSFKTAVGLATNAGEAALAAASKCANGKNSVELSPASCGASLMDSFRGSFSGIQRAITGRSQGSPDEVGLQQQGCLETLTKVFIKNFVSTGRFIVDVSKWVGQKAADGGRWLKEKAVAIFEADNKSSDAALLAASQSDSLLKRLQSTNPGDVWNAMVQWVGSVLDGFKRIFTDQLGCQVWSGVPMESICLSPLSFDCVSCGQLANLVCGTIGFLGSEAIMSVMTGFAIGAAERVAVEVKNLLKAKMVGNAPKLAILQEQIRAASNAAVTASSAKARQVVDMADRIAPGAFSRELNARIATLNVPQAMDNVMTTYPGMRSVRSVHYKSLGAGREAADLWISRLAGDSTFLGKVAEAAKYTQLEKAYQEFAEQVARAVRSSRTGKLSAKQIAEFSEKFHKQYLYQAVDTLKSGETVAHLSGKSIRIADRALVVDGVIPPKSFVYKPGINAESLSRLSGSETVETIVSKLKAEDGLISLRSQIISGAALPENVPSAIREGVAYAASRELPKSSLERFSTNVAARQFARKQAQERLDLTLGVNRNSNFILISSEMF